MSDISAEYMEASRQNPHKFQPPTVSFLFFDGITESVSGKQTQPKLSSVVYLHVDRSSVQYQVLYIAMKDIYTPGIMYS